MCFDSEGEFLLTNIDCYSKLTTLGGLTLIGLTPKELKFRLPEIKPNDEYQLEIDEYRHESLGLSFWLLNGKVYYVTIYAKYSESGNEIIWPEKNN